MQTAQHTSQAIPAERRLQELAVHLLIPPEPFGTYTEAVQARSLLFLSETSPTEGRTAKFVGRVGAERFRAVEGPSGTTTNP
jgi:hypothetical protein